MVKSKGDCSHLHPGKHGGSGAIDFGPVSTAIIAPDGGDGGDAWAPLRPRPDEALIRADEALIRAFVRAHRWKRMLEHGKY